MARFCRLAARNYVVRLSGKEQVSGRQCYVLTLLPRYEMSHAYKLWVDTETYYPVSKQENTIQGHTISLSLFRWIEFPSQIPGQALANLFPASAKRVDPSPTTVFTDIRKLRAAYHDEPCLPVSMPGGFEFERCELIMDGPSPTVCFRYTDGWSWLSIFQSRRESPANVPGVKVFRSLQYARTPMGDTALAYRAGEMTFTLIGRVEMKGLVCITNALDPHREQAYLQDTSKAFKVPLTTLANMRSQGLGVDTINAILEINLRSRKPLARLVALIRDGYGWTEVARLLHLDARRFSSRVRAFECR
jgi:hypothetical protein